MQPLIAVRRSQTNDMFHPSEQDILFREFISSKVLSSAEDLEKTLKEKRLYSVEIENYEQPGVLHSIAKIIRGYSRAGNHNPICAKVENGSKRKSAVIHVTGDISGLELTQTLGRCSGKYGVKYTIKPKS